MAVIQLRQKIGAVAVLPAQAGHRGSFVSSVQFMTRVLPLVRSISAVHREDEGPALVAEAA